MIINFVVKGVRLGQKIPLVGGDSGGDRKIYDKIISFLSLALKC